MAVGAAGADAAPQREVERVGQSADAAGRLVLGARKPIGTHACGLGGAVRQATRPSHPELRGATRSCSRPDEPSAAVPAEAGRGAAGGQRSGVGGRRRVRYRSPRAPQPGTGHRRARGRGDVHAARARPPAVGAVDHRRAARWAHGRDRQGPPRHGRRPRRRRAGHAVSRPHPRPPGIRTRWLAARQPADRREATPRWPHRPRRGDGRAGALAARARAESHSADRLAHRRAAKRPGAGRLAALGHAGNGTQRADLSAPAPRTLAPALGRPQAHQGPIRRDGQRRGPGGRLWRGARVSSNGGGRRP